MGLGAYIWEVTTADGQTIRQYDAAGQEQSIEVCRDSHVRRIVLTPRPQYPRHAPIVWHLEDDEDWRKFWTRTFHVLSDDSTIEAPVIDVLVFASPRNTRLAIQHDGTIVLSSREH